MGGYWLKDPDGETAVTITGEGATLHAYARQIAAAMNLTTLDQRINYNAEAAGYGARKER
jgi:hypothetical protein